MKEHKKKINQNCSYGIVTVFTVLLFLFVMSAVTGKGWLDTNVCNTYALQADAWRRGHLDLGQNYSWLEIAEFNGKFYCSFPPFPSYVLLPSSVPIQYLSS